MLITDILKNGIDEVGPVYHRGKPSKLDSVYVPVDSALLERANTGDVVTISPGNLPGVKQTKK